MELQSAKQKLHIKKKDRPGQALISRQRRGGKYKYKERDRFGLEKWTNTNTKRERQVWIGKVDLLS